MKQKNFEAKLLTTEDLAYRWGMSEGTLENQRNMKRGPAFIKLGKGSSAPVRYRLSDILEYEEKMLRGKK